MTLAALLLVDDKDHTILALADSLRESFAVFTAESGAKALQLLAREDIAIVVVDQDSAGMSGIELMAQVKSLRPQAVGVVIMAHPRVELFNAAARLGNISAYIGKPWKADQVVRQLRETALQSQQGAHIEPQALTLTLLDHLEDGVVACDMSGKVVMVNRPAREWCGLEVGRQLQRGLPDRYRLYYADGVTPLPHSATPLMRALHGEMVRDARILIRVKDQPLRHIIDNAGPVYDERGRQLGAIGTLHDITQRMEAEAVVRREQYLLYALLDNVPDIIYFKDMQSRFTRINRAAAVRFGLSDPELAVGKTDQDFYPPEYARLMYEDETAIISTGQPIVAKEEYVTLPNHPPAWMLTTKMPLRDQSGQIVGTFGISRDITETKLAEDRLRYVGTHDELTGLKSRAFFVDELSRLERENEYPVSIVMVDVDDVKAVNDRWGHQAGDRLLQETAELLKANARNGDVVARIGGDEFVVLMPGASEVVVEATLAGLKFALEMHNASRPDFVVSMSVGAATANGGEPLRNLMAEADIRMYKDKRGKRIAAKYLL